MNRGGKLAILSLAAALGACQPGWVRLDGSRADAEELSRARALCEVDAKLAALEKARAANSVEASKASSNEARMLRLDDFESENYRVYQEIDACMGRQGLQRPR